MPCLKRLARRLYRQIDIGCIAFRYSSKEFTIAGAMCFESLARNSIDKLTVNERARFY